jgi:glycosyltransferase involved in cell wall biosynthesis
MAHKIRIDGYRRLAAILQRDNRSFRLEISTALHEGGAFDESFFVVGEEISDVFGGRVRFLGFLADAEVSERLRDVDALVAFFPNGVRENNTTVLSAMTHGCAVITNLDPDSPPWMMHDHTVFDVNQLTYFPDKVSLRRVGDAAALIASAYNFERLAQILVRNYS